MRCLYCGKELALLKRWTSGGEFCSDAHRQQYQEEYNQLALNRLLQAKPQAKPQEPKPQENKPQENKAPDTKVQEQKGRPEASLPEKPSEIRPAAQKPLPAPEPPKEPSRARLPEPEPQPVAKKIEEEPAPAEGTFFIELPVPVAAGAAEVVATETDFERHFRPTLPNLRESANGEQWQTELVAAGQVTIVPSFVMADSPARVSEGKLELREVVRPAPMVEFDLRTAGATGISEISEEPMDIIIFPQPPPKEPSLWQEGERSFAFETELGAMTRMVFRTTGIEDNEEGEIPTTAEAAQPAPARAPEPVRAAPASAPAASKAPQSIPVRAVNEPARPATPVISKPASPSVYRPAARPAAETAPRVEPSVAQAPAPQTPAPQTPAPQTKTEVIPEAPAKPLPVTLHGLAAGRGKPVQVFASAVSSEVDLQVPRSSALPLRPVMTIAAAPIAAKETKEERKPAERTVMVKADPRRQPSARPDPRFSNGKSPKPGPEPQHEKFEEPKVAVATAVKEPEPVPVKEPPKEPPKEKFAAPPPKPVPPPDLDLPSLTLNTGGGFWGKLPVAGKAGIGIGGVLAIAGIIFAVSHGSSPKPVSAGPQIVEGPALSAVESGWITDWGTEPGVRREHEISVLRPSLNLTDYRLEFEAQIDTKALGWIYRAQDGKNYYVNKLEIVKPGLQPTIALVRFAVINGQEQPRAQFPLTMSVHLDTLYKIRFDAVGDRFTTYVQDQQVDEWTDDRLKMGGVGLYNERGERMALKGTVNVVPLVIKK